MNNPTLGLGCEAMIGRADIEESKSNVAMNAWLPQASYPCGNFSDTSSSTVPTTKGSIGHAFTVGRGTEPPNQRSFYPFVQQEISGLLELLVGHLCCRVTDVPPQPNSPPDLVRGLCCSKITRIQYIFNHVSAFTSRVVVFQVRLLSHLGYTSGVKAQSQTRVKLNRVFFPR
jgi:hypothetical protein